jgi:hypothetical protein
MQEHFAAYEAEPVKITRLRLRPAQRRVDVRLHVSKRSTITVTLRAGSQVAGRVTRSVMRGGERIRFPRPRSRRALSAVVGAISLSGVESSVVTR